MLTSCTSMVLFDNYPLELKDWWVVTIQDLQPSILTFSVQFSPWVMSYPLRPHGLQHSRLPCPSPSPRVCSNSCLLSWWCIQPSRPLSSPSLHALVFLSIRVFSKSPGKGSFPKDLGKDPFPGSCLRIRWPKDWSFSFSISPYSGYSGLISFRIDWFNLFAVSGTLNLLLYNY